MLIDHVTPEAAKVEQARYDYIKRVEALRTACVEFAKTYGVERAKETLDRMKGDVTLWGRS